MSIPPFDSTTYSTYTQSPNPSWTYGQKVDTTPAGKDWLAGESAGWKVFNTAETDKVDIYKLFISGIVPRPIAFVSTINEEGVENLAPFSWFNTVTNYPPIISFACNHSAPGRLKDTTTNLKNSQGFTVNIISEPFVENANSTAIDAPRGFDEWSISGLTKAKCVEIKASRVKESAFSMECELYKSIDITHPVTGEHNNTLILAHVKYIHVRKDMLTDKGVIDLTKLKPVARLGDISYARVGDAYRIARPSWAQDEAKIQEVLRTLSSL
jgi:flavin reductase (DIM6/NTAB) family NADH-FMN oxidoreductase RutF